MFKRCGVLFLGLLVLSSSASFAQQCRNVSPAQYGYQGVASGAYYDARTGGRYVNPAANYNAYNQVPNNVRVYQDQLNQSYQVNAYGQAYGNPGGAYGYNSSPGFGGASYGYSNQNGQVTITPQYSPNQVGYVGVNPWNGYAGNSYNGYNYGQVQNQQFNRGRNCRPQNNPGQRFWVNR